MSTRPTVAGVPVRRLALAVGLIIVAAATVAVVFRLAHDPREWTPLEASQSASGFTAVVEQNARLDSGPTAVRVLAQRPDGSTFESHVFFVSNGGGLLPSGACSMRWPRSELLEVTCDGALQDPATRLFDVAR